jgi:hypothetical protein
MPSIKDAMQEVGYYQGVSDDNFPRDEESNFSHRSMDNGFHALKFDIVRMRRGKLYS